ncbi:hypothetical protein JTB14_031762 [Gonioctena quinquepunctata]|nr:hypothetical protein JTB14_031762 [Gonioctena quinquepunctata]
MDSRLAEIKGVMPYFDDVLMVAESADQLEVELRSVLKRFEGDGLRLRADKCEFFATVAEPLHELLHKGISWKWTTEEQDAFDKFKRMLSSSKNLAHNDEKKALVLTCDASPYGVGAVSSHLDECEVIPPRMLRWILILSSYDYEVVYVLGTQIPHADALSRLPLTSQDIEGPPLQEVLMLESVPEKSFTVEEIAKKTKEDRILSKVSFWIQTGWTDDENRVPEELKQFWQQRNELSMYNGCSLWGNRVIIPSIETNQVLQILHAMHPGIVRMKALARSHVWWPGLDADIERLVRGCSVCQENRNMPPKAVLHPWEKTREPWTRLHIDFAGRTQGSLFSIVVDSFSK